MEAGLDVSTSTIVLLGLAALAAGFVDAVVGGGGLVQLPALLVGLPGAAPVQILATNKLASICGTTVSSVTYSRRIRPDPRTFGPLMLFAFLGSAAGGGYPQWNCNCDTCRRASPTIITQ